MNAKRIAIICITLLTLGVLVFLVRMRVNQAVIDPNKMQVTTSFYPLYFFASQIGGEKVNVYNITPAGAEPHDYEPTAQDMTHIDASKVLFLSGNSLEAWGEKIRQNIDTTRTRTVTVGEGLATQQSSEDGKQVVDPHVWLNPVLAEKMVDKITMALTQADEQNAPYYEENSTALKQKLQNLDAEYRTGLMMCAQKSIVTSHAAFGYLASAYGLNQVAIAGISPDAEPSQKTLSDIANFVEKNNVHYIFFENLLSPKLAETLARETGAKTLVLDPLEGISEEDQRLGKDYFTVMQQNLKNLELALSCQPG